MELLSPYGVGNVTNSESTNHRLNYPDVRPAAPAAAARPGYGPGVGAERGGAGEPESPFHSPFRFEISFECSEALTDDLEWKIISVGSAESDEFDQILDSVSIGPVSAGRHMFVFQADAPNSSLSQETDAVGVTLVLITCTYRGHEFNRVGYYVNKEYPNPELWENQPLTRDFSQLQWNILASNPRVTRFHIYWDNQEDRLEALENQDPTLGCGLPLSYTPVKGLVPQGCIPSLLPENSMDCI
ncbi:Histone chaperone ASF1B [Heterocephalus glaber]|uniref:Histone chaperone ASF1B n=1 Tax=Heterocephalus glaber TaxID=10181 RepID=G5APL0_HETGA|nr:Histone chaperone ASF1B [Heterocephalus glaber]